MSSTFCSYFNGTILSEVWTDFQHFFHSSEGQFCQGVQKDWLDWFLRTANSWHNKTENWFKVFFSSLTVFYSALSSSTTVQPAQSQQSTREVHVFMHAWTYHWWQQKYTHVMNKELLAIGANYHLPQLRNLSRRLQYPYLIIQWSQWISRMGGVGWVRFNKCSTHLAHLKHIWVAGNLNSRNLSSNFPLLKYSSNVLNVCPATQDKWYWVGHQA